MHTNLSSKFLFYNFNTFRQTQRLAPLKIRHSIIANDDFALNVVQSHNWQYFIETLLHISGNETNLDDYNLENDEDFDRYSIIQKTLDNLKYCRNFYEDFLTTSHTFFTKKFKNFLTILSKKWKMIYQTKFIIQKKIKNLTVISKF